MVPQGQVDVEEFFKKRTIARLQKNELDLFQRANPDDDDTILFFKALKVDIKKESYIDLPLRDRSKFAQARLSCSLAACDSARPRKACRLCGLGEDETIQHLLCLCPSIEGIRRHLFHPKLGPNRDAPVLHKWVQIFKQPMKRIKEFLDSADEVYKNIVKTPLFNDPVPQATKIPGAQEMAFARQQTTQIIGGSEDSS